MKSRRLAPPHLLMHYTCSTAIRHRYTRVPSLLGLHPDHHMRVCGQPNTACWLLGCRTATLERCLRRLEWEKARELEAKAVADQQEAERMAMQAIDWCVPALPSMCSRRLLLL